MPDLSVLVTVLTLDACDTQVYSVYIMLLTLFTVTSAAQEEEEKSTWLHSLYVNHDIKCGLTCLWLKEVPYIIP